MADLLPPIVVELLAKTDKFAPGMDKARAEMGTFAKDAESATGRVGAAEEAMASRGKKAAGDLEKAHQDLESKSSGFASRMQGMFGKLGATMGGWGLPFSESVSAMGEKIGEAETKGKKFTQALSEVGKVATLGMAAGLGAAAAEGIHLAENFQQSTASLSAHADISTKAAQQIGNAFLGTAGKTTFSAQEMMTAFAPISGQFQTMYGHALNASDSLTFMKAAMDAAEASGSPLTDTAKALADTMMVYKTNVGGAGDASNTMWNISKSLGISMTDLGSSLQRLEPRIANSGMTLKQTGAFMLELGKEAGGGRQAMRLAGTAIQALVSPSTSAQKALSAMGVSLTDSNGKFIGVRAAIGKLHDAFAKLPGDQAAMAAGQKILANQAELAKLKTEDQTKAVKAQEKQLTAQDGVLQIQSKQLSTNSAMQAIFGRNANLMASMVAGGVPAFDSATKAVSKQGEAEKAAEKQAKTFHGQIEKLKSAGEDLGVRLGNFLIPKIQSLMSFIAESISWFEQHKTVAEALAGVFGGALSLAVGAFAVNKIAGLVKGTAQAVKSLGQLESTVVRVATTLLQKFGVIKSGAADMSQQVSQSAEQQASNVEKTAQQEATGVETAANEEKSGAISSAQQKAQGVEAAANTEKNTVIADADAEKNTVESDMAAVTTAEEGALATTTTDMGTIEGEAATAERTVQTDMAGATGAESTAAAGGASMLGGFAGAPALPVIAAVPKIISDVKHAYAHPGQMNSWIGPPIPKKLTNLAKWAQGGVLTHPTIGLVGEAGPEAIIPLTDPARARQVMAQASAYNPNLLGEDLSGSGGSSGPMVSSSTTNHNAQTITINMLGSTTDPYTLGEQIGWEIRNMTAAGVA